MELYRLSSSKYGRKLSGKGAAISGGRWSSIGTEIIYCAANRSLAMAEVAVHFSIGTLPLDYMMMTLFVPDATSVSEIQVDDLPPNWNLFPHLKETQTIGDQFISKSDSCLLKVPSAVTPGDFNYLINPMHGDFAGIQIVEYLRFPFDKRLFKI